MKRRGLTSRGILVLPRGNAVARTAFKVLNNERNWWRVRDRFGRSGFAPNTILATEYVVCWHREPEIGWDYFGLAFGCQYAWHLHCTLYLPESDDGSFS